MSQTDQGTAATQQQPIKFTEVTDFRTNVDKNTGWLPLGAHAAAMKTALNLYKPGPEDLRDGVLPPLESVNVTWSRSQVNGMIARAIVTVTRPFGVCVSEKRTRIIIKAYTESMNDPCHHTRELRRREELRNGTRSSETHRGRKPVGRKPVGRKSS